MGPEATITRTVEMIPEIDVIEDLIPETGALIHDTILEIGDTIPGMILEI